MCVLSPLCGDVMDSQGDAKDGQSPVADVTSQMPFGLLLCISYLHGSYTNPSIVYRRLFPKQSHFATNWHNEITIAREESGSHLLTALSYPIVVQPTMSKVSMVPVLPGRLANATGSPPFIEPMSSELILEDVLVTCTA